MTSPTVAKASIQAGRNGLKLRETSAEKVLLSALGLSDGAQPFPWQLRLLEAFRRGEIPRSLDVPTGLGKTAVIAIWLVARLFGGPVPRRLVYIVDRRAVVDQASAVAERLRSWIGRGDEFGQALGLGDRHLPVSTLRGQFVDNREWMEDPASPGIVVGTVDMIGSRLLFGGYRASRKIRPYLAGLLGHDGLFAIDEAHLVPPFERLLERIALRSDGLRGRADSEVARPPMPRLLSLSATGRSRGGEVFDLDERDLAHPEVAQRLRAPKTIAMTELGAKADIATEAAERVWAMSQEADAPRRYLVFLTRRSDAEKALGHLRKLVGLDKLKKGESPAAAVELLVGGRRVYDRQRAADRLESLGFLAGTGAAPSVPAFLFATSAGEVGVDLDADDMVGDAVPWERLVQRLGRVNRRGRGQARVELLKEPTDAKAPEAEVARIEAMQQLLVQLPHHGDGGRDGSPGALRDVQAAARSDEDLARLVERATTPPPLYPELDRPTLDAWAMTSLEDHPGRPAIAPWLRGWVEDRPQTAIAWRKHLPVTTARQPVPAADIARYFEAAPLHTSEVLEAETWYAINWLAKVASRLVKQTKKGAEDQPALDDVVAFVRSGPTEAMRPLRLRELDAAKKELERRVVYPGGELVLDARVGGLAWGLLEPSEAAVPATMEDDAWSGREIVPYRLTPETGEDDSQSRDLVDAGWLRRARIPIETSGEGEPTRWLVVWRRPYDATTEDDRSAGQYQTLADHQACAEAKAERLAEAMKLSSDAKRVLKIAARLHDEGKRAPRWQAAFRAPRNAQVAYAKTPGPIDIHRLDGYRHELGSIPHAERDEELRGLPEDQRDLVLHLIASHHGFARPLISTRSCDDAPPSALKRRAQEIALRFWRLQEQWGPWGLAWWEALLRAADQLASRENLASSRKEVG